MTTSPITVSPMTGLKTILNMENVPTMKQLKKTSAFKNADPAFKNVSIQMYNHMKNLSRTDRNTASVITSVVRGFGSEKSKKILFLIANEIADKYEKKKSEEIIEEVVEQKPDTLSIFEHDSWEDIDEFDLPVFVKSSPTPSPSPSPITSPFVSSMNSTPTPSPVPEEEIPPPSPPPITSRTPSPCPWGNQRRKVYSISFEKETPKIDHRIVFAIKIQQWWRKNMTQIWESTCKPVHKSVHREFCKPVVEVSKEKSNKFTMLCRHFLKGKCNRGDKCNFAHGMEQWNPNCCMFKHKCNKGDNCKWYHPDRETKEEFAKRTKMIK